MEKNKKAKWKSREEHNDYIHAECSGCGFQVESYDAVETGRSSTDYIKAKWKFCPKCGAEMTV
jgi:predicted nucleic-acid-binding Zn-ribbon protein|nr:MAG TPA: Transcription initiation factor IIE, alpha FINGER, Transcription [Caudoviricetes sp.]